MMKISVAAVLLLLATSTGYVAQAAKTIKPAEVQTLGLDRKALRDIFPLQAGTVAIRIPGGLTVYGVDGKQLGRRLSVADDATIDDGNVHLYGDGRRLAYFGRDGSIHDYDLVKEGPARIMHINAGSAVERPIGVIDRHLLAYVKVVEKKAGGFVSRLKRIGQKPELESRIVIADRGAPDNVKAELPLKRTLNGKTVYQLRALSFIEGSGGLLLARYAGAVQVWRVERDGSTGQVSVDPKPVVDVQAPAVNARADYNPRLGRVTFVYRDAAGSITAEEGRPRETKVKGVFYLSELRAWTLDTPPAAVDEKLSIDAETGNARVYRRDAPNVTVAKFRLA